MALLKKIAARLPERWQDELKRIHFGREISNDEFKAVEPEYALLDQFLKPGDWCLDIGANVGHYTKRLSDLVGPTGRVIAFEPVPATFALLAANASRFRHANVTLLNAAASNALDVVGMSIPRFDSGLTNYYEAHLSAASDAGLSVLTLRLDSLGIGQRLALAKIDAEGHEAVVLSGMRDLIARHRPVLIVETNSEAVVADLAAQGYAARPRQPGSANLLFTPRA